MEAGWCSHSSAEAPEDPAALACWALMESVDN